MKNIVLLLFTIATLFTACSRPDMMAYYKEDPLQSNYPQAWQELLLLPQEYLPQAATKHLRLPVLMHPYQKSNPGFINLKKFQKSLPEHELAQLKLWYAATFFHKPYITHYMVMEFGSETQAKHYVPRIASADPSKYIRVLRYKSILFSFVIRNFSQEVVDKNQDLQSQAWVDATLKRIMEKL